MRFAYSSVGRRKNTTQTNAGNPTSLKTAPVTETTTSKATAVMQSFAGTPSPWIASFKSCQTSHHAASCLLSVNTSWTVPLQVYSVTEWPLPYLPPLPLLTDLNDTLPAARRHSRLRIIINPFCTFTNKYRICCIGIWMRITKTKFKNSNLV